MKVKLIIVSPEVKPNEYDVALPTKIGRGHEAKLKLVHPQVSRLHCELFVDGDKLMIRDLESLNGTFVDQQRIDVDTAIPSGATVMIGTVMFRLVYGKDIDRVPPPAATKLDKTIGASGTLRQETVAKIAKGAAAANHTDKSKAKKQSPPPQPKESTKSSEVGGEDDDLDDFLKSIM
ncbi:MAG TPA: FHA domain-containing protein [Pirellulales bacterium]|jgi:predicted component of type VI protein secretion system|nr:FHA domain-containing protein [Pirellulales bacterium]